MAVSNPLPPGQRELDHYPRYGLWQFAHRFEQGPLPIRLDIGGDLQNPLQLDGKVLELMPRVEQDADIHCVTTWSWRGLHWSGVRLKDLYEQVVIPEGKPAAEIRYVVFRSRDNYRTYLPIEDALADDVLLVDRLDHKPLEWDHGAPLRLLAPAHYAFKNAKHVCAIEFRHSMKGYRPPAFHWTEHPRARTAFEERGIVLPGLLYRYLLRLAIPTVLWTFRRAAKKRGEN